MSKQNDRYQEALSLRKSGKTFREIGERLSVTPARAAQIVKKAEYNIEIAGEWTSGLPIRAINAMKNQGIHSRDEAVKAITQYPEQLLEAQNFGPKSFKELVEHLGVTLPEKEISCESDTITQKVKSGKKLTDEQKDLIIELLNQHFDKAGKP